MAKVKTVPQIKPEPAKNMLPGGTYKGKIIEFLEPKQSRAKEFLWYVCIKIQIEWDDEVYEGFAFVNGYPQAVMMIYRSRHVWLDKEFDIRVKADRYPVDGNIYNSFDIILTDGWAENDTST